MRRVLASLMVFVALAAGVSFIPNIEITVGGGRVGTTATPSGTELAIGATRTFDLPASAAKGGSGDDYPWKHLAKDSGYDRWGMSIRNCTSWVAWALHSRNGFDMPFHDHAKNWGSRARKLGFVVDNRPAVGAVAWSATGRFGHIAWVSEVSGTTVWVEEYNRAEDGNYGRRQITGGYEFIHFADLPAPPPAAASRPGPPAQVTVAAPAPQKSVRVVNDGRPSPNLQGGSVTPQGGPAEQGSSPKVQGGGSPQDQQAGGLQGTEGSRGAESTTTSPPPSTDPPPTTTTTTTTTAPPQLTRQLTVYNQVTNGPSSMREDTPAYLSTRTTNYCKRIGCAVTNTDMGTGHVVTAYCVKHGDRTTNGEDGSAVDDANPALYSSTLWFGIRWSDGRTGYLSEVWINPSHRGVSNLPMC